MRVCLVVANDLDYGLDLADTLDKASMSVTLYLSHTRLGLYLPNGRSAHGFKPADHLIQRLYELRLVPSACDVRVFRFPRIRDPRSFLVVRRIVQSIRKERVDLVHILMGPGELWIAVLACLLCDVPVVSTIIIPKPNVGESLPAFVLWALHRLLVYGSNVVIVNGAEQVPLVHRLYGIPTNRIAYVPLGPRSTALKWCSQGEGEEPGTVLFCGRAHPHKGLEYLVRAQPIINRQVSHARIIIAAHGDELERCRTMIQDASKFEIHEGFVPSDQLAAFFQRASVVTLPYLSASTSGILNTAYVFGKPVVATTVGCLPEYVVEGVTGLLVPPSDSERLANAVVRLLLDNALRKRMGRNARHWIDEEQKKVAELSLRAYEEAIGAYKNRRRTGPNGMHILSRVLCRFF